MQSIISEKLAQVLEILPTVPAEHRVGSPLYSFLKKETRKEVEQCFGESTPLRIYIKGIGDLIFPFHSMGHINSLNLFDMDEVIIFSFYMQNRHRYKKVTDIGANLGLHSLILGKLGFEVECYEPDLKHFEILESNMACNFLKSIKAHRAAVSNQKADMEFVRILGNTTGSHIRGSKKNPYGELEITKVKALPFNEVVKGADLVKLDVEGHEKEIFRSVTRETFLNTDGMLSLHDEENARVCYEVFRNLGINMFSQKTGWKKVRQLSDVPTGHTEGSLFVTSKEQMHWERSSG